MGIGVSTEKLFLNVSCGKLVNKKKGISTFSYTGTLIDIVQVLDEFEGKSISKIKLSMKDNAPGSSEVAEVSFSEESWYSQGFFARISKINLAEPFTIGVNGSDVNEKVSFCWMKQDSYTGNPDPLKKGIVDADKDFPRPTKTARGKDNYDALLEASMPIVEALKSQLAGIVHEKVEALPHNKVAAGKAGDEKAKNPMQSEQIDDGLPF